MAPGHCRFTKSRACYHSYRQTLATAGRGKLHSFCRFSQISRVADNEGPSIILEIDKKRASMAQPTATPLNMSLEEKLDKIRMPKLQNQQQVCWNAAL